jgi:hypothetical protein
MWRKEEFSFHLLSGHSLKRDNRRDYSRQAKIKRKTSSWSSESDLALAPPSKVKSKQGF